MKFRPRKQNNNRVLINPPTTVNSVHQSKTSFLSFSFRCNTQCYLRFHELSLLH